MQKLPVNRLFKLAQEKVWLGEVTVPLMTIAVDWDVRQQNKQNHSVGSGIYHSHLHHNWWVGGGGFSFNQ